jgi:transposase
MSRTRNHSRSAAPAPSVNRAGANPPSEASTTLTVVPAANTPLPCRDGPPVADPPTPIGVGIDTSRYGHHASFLRPDLQPAAADLAFVESAQGYQQLRDRLDAIASKHGRVHFHFRLDVAGRYADNLLAFLHSLFPPEADASCRATISCGDPQRNKNYRAAIFGTKKSDPVESTAAARYALTEKPEPTPVVTPQLRLLTQIASRLESQARQGTRLANQLHNLLASVFPELSLIVADIKAGWVLKLLHRYPTAAKLATARPSSLEAIPFLPHEHIPSLLANARVSIAALAGPLAEQLVRDQVRQLQDALVRQKSLEKMLVHAYRQLAEPNHLDTIIGIGAVTAAILTAKIVDSARFREPGKLVGYFGIFPVQASSGLDREGKPRAAKRLLMCKRGNDLVRRYLYLAALSAAQHNPAVRPLYQRARAKHPDHPGIAVGHAMRKLLHLVLTVWKTGKPFDPAHYPWDQAAHLEGKADLPSTKAPTPTIPAECAAASAPAAGHKNPEIQPERSVVAAAGGTASVTALPAANNLQAGPSAAACPAAQARNQPRSQPARAATSWIDFEHLKTQLPLQRVLEHLGILSELRGRDRQRRGACPIHGHQGQRRGRTFNVHLDKNVFYCFDPQCGIQGDVIDLWAAVKGLNLRDAAVDLMQTFALEPAPGTEKRNG